MNCITTKTSMLQLALDPSRADIVRAEAVFPRHKAEFHFTTIQGYVV